VKKYFCITLVLLFLCFPVVLFAEEERSVTSEQTVTLEDSLYGELPEEILTKNYLATIQEILGLYGESWKIEILKKDYKVLPIVDVEGRYLMNWEWDFAYYANLIKTHNQKDFLLIADEGILPIGYFEPEEEGGEYQLRAGPYSRTMTDSFLTELKAIKPYMVFFDQICKVEQVIPVSGGYGLWAVYYKTDKGVFVKYMEAPDRPGWDLFEEGEKKAILFTEQGISEARETVFGERRKKNREQYEKTGEAAIGGGFLGMLKDLSKTDIKLAFVEPGNPVPEHLQAELNTLLGVEPPVSTEGPDTDVPTGITTTDTTTTDIPTSENPASTDDGSVATDREIPWLWIGIGAGALVVVALAIILLTKKKK